MLRLILLLLLMALAARAYLLMNAPGTPAGRALQPDGAATTLAMREPPPAAVERELPPMASLSQTVERPLFTPTRRPPRVDEEAVEDVVPATESAPARAELPPPRLALTAVFRTPDTQLALLRHAVTGEVSSVRPGDDVDGWQVELIEPDRVVLLKEATRHTLRLRVYERPPPGAAPLPRRLPAPAAPLRPGEEGTLPLSPGAAGGEG